MSLTARDLEMFAAIGVTPSMLDRAGVQRVSHVESRERCGIQYRSEHLEGIATPYLDPETERVRTWRVRRDNPEIKSDGTPIAKYVSPPDHRHLYFGPGCNGALRDPFRPAIIVEAEKSVLATVEAASRANRTVPFALATGGCWGWRGVTGKGTSPNGARVDEKGPLPDFDRVAWTGRDTVIVFDANAATNEKVQAARRALAAELSRRGANVRIATLPVEPDVNGPDDFIGKHGAEMFWRLIDAAKPATARQKPEKPPKKQQGHEVQLEDPEPWPDLVDGATLLDTIAATCTRYLALPAHASTALALWVLHAYAFGASFTTPFLAITSPAKRCGKTLLLIVLGALVPRRLFAANVTPAILFRTIEKYSPTLLIDEADTFVRDDDELRGVLNSGHTKTTAIAIRAVGDDHDPRAFSTWCPKAIALIGKLPGTLADRAIEVRMRRRTAGEQVERLRQDRIDSQCADIRRQAVTWANDRLHELQDADPNVPEALHDRAADCWRPLLAIADQAGGTWPERAREAALALSDEASDDDAATLLLGDIQEVFAAAGDPEVIGSTALVERLVAREDRPWAEWSKGKPISTAKLARMLAGYGVHPAGTVRIAETTVKGYRREAFAEVWERYSPDPKASHRNKPNGNGAEPAISNRHTENGCDGLQSVTNPMNTERCYGVTDRETGKGPAARLPIDQDDEAAGRGRF